MTSSTTNTLTPILTPRLPPELLDTIIDTLQLLRLAAPDAITRRSHYDTLRTCILVSKSFRFRSLTYIYACVCIYNAQYGRGLARQVSVVAGELREIMDPPPSVAATLGGGVGRYIRMVSLSFAVYSMAMALVQYETVTGGAGAGAGAGEQVKEFLDDENLLWVLGCLGRKEECRVTRFALNLSAGHFFTPRGVDWSDLSSAFQERFIALATSPHLRSLEIKNINQIPLSLLRNPHLHSLHLQQNVYDLTGSAPPPLPSHAVLATLPVPDLDAGAYAYKLSNSNPAHAHLRRFWTDHSYLYREILPLTLAEGLECLEATNTVAGHVLDTWEIIEMAKDSLTRLKIVYAGGVSPLAPFDLGHIPHLEAFSHVHNGIFRYSRPNYPGLVTLGKLIETHTPMHQLRTISLSFQFEEIGPQEDFIDPKKEPQWQFLDNVLSGPMYPALREVTVHISVIAIVAYAPDFDAKKFMSITETPMRDSFPKLTASKDVAFDLKLDLSVDPQDFPV